MLFHNYFLYIYLAAYVTGIAIVEEEYTEVDSIEIVQDIWVVPKNYHSPNADLDSTIPDASISEYFCVNDVIPGHGFQEIPIWKLGKLDSKGTK